MDWNRCAISALNLQLHALATNFLAAARDVLEQIREWEPCISYTDGHEDFDDNQPISANRFDFSLGHMLRNTNVIKIK